MEDVFVARVSRRENHHKIDLVKELGVSEEVLMVGVLLHRMWARGRRDD